MKLWSRTDTSLLSRWWWTIDRASLAAILTMIAVGLVLILAASPPVAARHHLAPYHFINRQLIFVAPALVVLVACSLLDRARVLRLALPAAGVCFLLLLATLALGPNVNGAHRWLSLGSFLLQPSEFLKPAFVLVLAAVLSERAKLAQVQRYGLSFILLLVVVIPLSLQPDYGQAALFTMAWGAMMFLAGLPVVFMGALAGAGAGAAMFVYLNSQHVAARINSFLDPAGPSYQVDKSLGAFRAGGFFGEGLGEGRLKWNLPDAHTDFIFAVAGEEYGIVLCLVIIALFGFVVLRGLVAAMREEDQYAQLAIAGLTLLLALQAFINLGVNVHLLPAKGMTLPFVSYGGSSLLAASMLAGLLLSLTRRRIRGQLPRGLGLAGSAV